MVPGGGLGGGVYGGREFSAGTLQGCSGATNFRPAAVCSTSQNPFSIAVFGGFSTFEQPSTLYGEG